MVSLPKLKITYLCDTKAAKGFKTNRSMAVVGVRPIATHYRLHSSA